MTLIKAARGRDSGTGRGVNVEGFTTTTEEVDFQRVIRMILFESSDSILSIAKTKAISLSLISASTTGTLWVRLSLRHWFNWGGWMGAAAKEESSIAAAAWLEAVFSLATFVVSSLTHFGL